MRRRVTYALALAALLALGLPAGSGWAEDAQKPEAAKPQSNECVYGWQMMTPEEMTTHHAAMLAAKTPAERQAVRNAHHAQMVARAKQRGVTLPDQPGPPGCTMGPGMMGGGRGMGPGMMGGGRGAGGGMMQPGSAAPSDAPPQDSGARSPSDPSAQ
jgi:hypothetical protein